MNMERIRYFTQIQESGYDSISYYKDLILTDLTKDQDLLELLNNKTLLLSRPNDFYNTNIFSFLKIPDAQSTVKNFLCFELDTVDTVTANSHKAVYELVFRCITHVDDVETPWGMNRHDLMAAIIKDRFTYSNILGTQLEKTQDKGYTAESSYYYRVIRFHTTQNNDLRQLQRKNLLDLDREKYGTKQ